MKEFNDIAFADKNNGMTIWGIAGPTTFTDSILSIRVGDILIKNENYKHSTNFQKIKIIKIRARYYECIVLEINNKPIIDNHHRFYALAKIGAKYIKFSLPKRDSELNLWEHDKDSMRLKKLERIFANE